MGEHKHISFLGVTKRQLQSTILFGAVTLSWSGGGGAKKRKKMTWRDRRRSILKYLLSHGRIQTIDGGDRDCSNLKREEGWLYGHQY